MKTFKYVCVFVLMLGLIVPAGAVEIPDTGDLYGDLYVILRDVNGVPILSDDGCIQPISAVDAQVTIPTSDGSLTITATIGEPFALPSYTDTLGDLVECELYADETTDMATWVQTVDFGRLNLARAPESVTAHAFDEAITKMNTANTITIDPSGRLMLTLPDEEDGYVAKTIDSPAENLALYIKMMIDGHWITENVEPVVNGGRPEDKGPPEGDGPSIEDRPVLNDDAIELLGFLEYGGLGDVSRTSGEDLTPQELHLAASLLAAAADKTGNITLDMIVYINFIYGINQIGSLPSNVEGETYFDFKSMVYNRQTTFGSRSSGPCDPSFIWVLQPELDNGSEVLNHFVTTCMNVLGHELDPADTGYQPNAVHFTHMVEAYTTVFDENGDPLTYDFNNNVRGFSQAADDALQVLEYIHNYKVPEDLYPDD